MTREEEEGGRRGRLVNGGRQGKGVKADLVESRTSKPLEGKWTDPRGRLHLDINATGKVN